MSDSSRIRSVDRAITLLHLVANAGEARVTDLAGRLDLHKSTVSRLLSTLQSHGLVDQDGDSGRFRLGWGIVRLAGAVDHAFDLGSVSRPLCNELARVTGETVNVVILDGTSTMCIDQVIGAASVTTVNWVGKRGPLHATASGKVLVAHLPADEAHRLLAGPLPALTSATIIDPTDLLADLAAVRACGSATSIDEQEQGLTSVAAPVFGADDDTVVAALAVSGPSFRLAGDRLDEVVGETMSTAAHISERTGHVRQELADPSEASDPR